MEASSSDTSSLPDTEQEVEPTQYPYDLDIAHQLYEDQVENFMRQQRGEPLLDVDQSKDNTLSHQLRDVPTVQLRPRTNSNEVPSVQHTNADRRRLLMRLETYSLGERIVKPDGNCQFRAVSDQLFRTPEYHRKVRQAVMEQLRANRERYEPYVPQDFDTYCHEMDRDSVWGDHVTLQAAADWYGVEIRVLSSFMTECCIDIQPEKRLGDRLLYLSFWAEVHYNSLYPLADMPKDPPPRKLLGSRRLFNLITSPPPPAYM